MVRRIVASGWLSQCQRLAELLGILILIVWCVVRVILRLLEMKVKRLRLLFGIRSESVSSNGRCTWQNGHFFWGSIFVLCQLQDDSPNAVSRPSHLNHQVLVVCRIVKFWTRAWKNVRWNDQKDHSVSR